MGWYDNNIVARILSTVDGNIGWNWIAITILTFFTFIVTYYYSGKNAVSKVTALWASLLLILYFKCRVISANYIFFPEKASIKYADYAFFLFVCIIFLALNGLKVSNIGREEKAASFLPDNPIDDEAKDLYHRNEVAKTMAKRIESFKIGRSSLAIGIVGKWGIGKTSFLNLIKKNINQEQSIIISFNPWQSPTPASVIEDFFSVLISEFKKFDVRLSSEIKKYASSLAEVDNNSFSKLLKYLIFFGSEQKGQTSNYDKVNATLKKLKKRIVIIIDDLDRLDKQELIEVLKLIRNTANFTNTVYVVAYAKEYVEQAIMDFNPHEHHRFLEKIFQFEFHVPFINSEMLRTKLIDLLSEGLSQKQKMSIIEAVNIKDNEENYLTDFFVRNPRDVTRLFNSITFSILKIENEINYTDFFLLELIRLKYYKIYSIIAENLALFFLYDGNKFRLRKENETYDEVATIIENYIKSKDTPEEKPSEPILHKLLSDISISDSEKNKILNLIDSLLDENRTEEKNHKNIDYRRFIYNFRNEKYFTIQQLQSDISSVEFEKARIGDFDQYRLTIVRWIDNGSLKELERLLSTITEFDNYQEWSNHLLISTFLLREYIQKNDPQYLSVPIGNTLKTLTYPIDHNKERIFFPKPTLSYHNYVIRFFKEAKDPYLTETSLLTFLSSPEFSNPLFPISLSSSVNYLRNYFKKYCSEHSEISHEFKILYYALRRLDGVPEFINELENQFVLFYHQNMQAKDLHEFILRTPEGKYKFNYEWCSKFFESDFMLTKYVQKNLDNNDKIVSEFLKFMNEWKVDKISASSYHFKHIVFD